MKYFDSKTFDFLRQLKVNNNRDWFQQNKALYLEQVRDPFLQLIRDLNPELQKITPYYSGNDRTNGGSLFRVYRDTRFSKDKTPYKPWAGARFWHSQGGRRGAPLYYLHIQPDNVFMAAGFFHPEAKILGQIRTFLQNNPNTWSTVTGDEAFKRTFELGGSSLKRIPRGFDPDHVLAEDLKRKDFIVISHFTEKQACSGRLPGLFAKRCQQAGEFMDYLCASMEMEFYA
jgi:uncharacterized protein (TIGR02453 family)